MGAGELCEADDGENMKTTHPKFQFACLVDLETNERRKRIQDATGMSLPALIKAALAELERRMSNPNQLHTSK